MLRLLSPFITRDAVCTQPVDSKLVREDSIFFYDKDGFELTHLEQEYYYASGFEQFMTSCLNHYCWQEQWFELEIPNGFVLDHSIVLHRCSFEGEAKKQLISHSKMIPKLAYLLRCPSKWGLDFNLDFIDNEGKLTEVIHIEIDTKVYHDFLQLKEELENIILTTDWKHVFMFLDQHREKWESLEGFDQNDWKARQLGFKKAEFTQKAI